MKRTILATAISALIISANAQVVPVSVSVDSDFYGPRDNIGVVIANDRPTSIVTWNHQSYCSIVTLQLLMENGDWMNYAPCMMGHPSTPFWMKPGTQTRIVLRDENSRTIGTYRIRFTYQVPASGFPSDSNFYVFTPTFRVGL